MLFIVFSNRKCCCLSLLEMRRIIRHRHFYWNFYVFFSGRNQFKKHSKNQLWFKFLKSKSKSTFYWIVYGSYISSTCPVSNVSGARKAGVPAVDPLCIEASSPKNSLQTPKSAIFTLPHSPSNKLSGLMSPWMIRW